MAFINIKFRLIRTTFLFMLLHLVANDALSQVQVNPDSIFYKVFDANLSEIGLRDLWKKNKPLAIISNDNCTGCAKYMAKEKNQFTFVFVLYNESLLEMRRIQRAYNLTAEHCFFVTCENIGIKKKEICAGTTPCMLKQSDKNYQFFNYEQVDSFTEGFTLKSSALAKKLKN